MPTYTQIDRKILWQLLVLAAPMVISQGAFAVMIFTDRYFMSLISPTHMAASLGGGVASFFCLSLFTGLLSYANALVAQYYGAKQWHKCPQVVTQGLILSLSFLLPLALISYLTGQLFSSLGHHPEQVVLEKRYFYILMWGSLLTLVKASLVSYFSGIGRTKTVMIADLLGVALNIPLSYLLIFGLWGLPELGIAGAALGTLVSSGFSLLVYGGFYFAKSHRTQFAVAEAFVFNKSLLRRYLRLGFPSGLELFLNVAAFNLFLLMFQSYGVPEGASAAIVFNWDILSFVPMMGLHIAIISLIGRFVGSGDMTKVNRIISAGFILGLGYSAILGIIFILFRGSLVDIFIDPGVHYREIHDLSTYMMVGLASYVMADSIILVTSGVLRGAGDTKWLLNTSVALHWSMLLAQFIVIKVLVLGPQTSWIIFVIMIITIATVYTFRLYGEKWRNPEALSKVLIEH